MFFKKATEFYEIFIVDLTLCSKCLIESEDFVNFGGLLRIVKETSKIYQTQRPCHFSKWLEFHNFKIFIFFLYRSNITDILQIFEQHLQTMADGWRSEPKVQPLFYGLLVTLYACLITVGATGNLLVILVCIYWSDSLFSGT